MVRPLPITSAYNLGGQRGVATALAAYVPVKIDIDGILIWAQTVCTWSYVPVFVDIERGWIGCAKRRRGALSPEDFLAWLKG